jgi:nicotinate-nucleotide adenylyltransferase
MPQYRSLSRKNNVAMYGGSFNPPHVGHLAVAKMILNFSREFDEVWFLPNNNSMDGKDLASAEQRLEMCRLLALHDGRIKVSDYEIVNKFKGETYHMIRRLLEEDFAKDENDFSFVVGMDAAKTLPNWPNSEYLLRMVRFVVVSRPGVEVDMKNAWFLEKPHIYMEYEDDNMRNVSSTDIRNIFKNDGMLSDVEHKLTPEVLEYIRGHCLYRGDS